MAGEARTSVRMGRMIGEALEADGISQAEFCRMVGVSTKHLNLVINGKAVAKDAQLDYWAFVLGRRWALSLEPMEARDV